ncbi:MAG: hypothetical protein R3248_02640 [Candidatus Promineifilaceae bacterium]|nr:hypothetical protein [Candidatus Promineifilaceae bacterium]
MTVFEVHTTNPQRVQLAFRSGIIASITTKFTSRPDITTKNRAFFEQFRISGKSKEKTSLFVGKEEIKQGLLQATWYTGGITVRIKRDRIRLEERAMRVPAALGAEIAYVRNVFDTLCTIAEVVETQADEV